MLTFIKTIGIKNILIAVLITIVGVWIAYEVTKYKAMVSQLEQSKKEIIKKDEQIKENEKNFDLAVEAYEKTLAIERLIVEQKTITSEQKEKVVTKQNKYKEAVIKRGEIKKDEKECSNFTLVHFD